MCYVTVCKVTKVKLSSELYRTKFKNHAERSVGQKVGIAYAGLVKLTHDKIPIGTYFRPITVLLGSRL